MLHKVLNLVDHAEEVGGQGSKGWGPCKHCQKRLKEDWSTYGALIAQYVASMISSAWSGWLLHWCRCVRLASDMVATGPSIFQVFSPCPDGSEHDGPLWAHQRRVLHRKILLQNQVPPKRQPVAPATAAVKRRRCTIAEAEEGLSMCLGRSFGAGPVLFFFVFSANMCCDLV